MTDVIEKLRAMRPSNVQKKKVLQGTDAVATVMDLGLQRRCSRAGEYWIREKNFSLQDYPELEMIKRLQGHDFMLIGKNQSLAEMDIERTVFLDTETTGLAGGAGTYAFIVGIASLERDQLVIRQYFMEDFSQEPALLLALTEQLAETSGIISYNGKAYDLPLMQNRVILNRITMDWNRFHQLDLLHASRRLWRPFVQDCRLSSMEEAVLGFCRENDVPGEMIPSLYFASLQTHDWAGLKPVFQHNALDLHSLVRLTGQAAMIFQSKSQTKHFHHLGVVKTYESLRLYDMAVNACVPEVPLTREEHQRLHLRQARNLKRLHRYQEAERIWLQLLQEMETFYPEPYIELIKHYEHRQKNWTAALALAERLLQRIELISTLGDQVEYEELARKIRMRQQRIHLKQKWAGRRKENAP